MGNAGSNQTSFVRPVHEFNARLCILDGSITLVFGEGRCLYDLGDCWNVPSGTIHEEHIEAERGPAMSPPNDHPAEDPWLAAIVESSDDAIIGKDLGGTILSWNMAAERLFGYTATEAIGQPITIILPPDRTEEEQFILDRILRGEKVDHYEATRRGKDGRIINVWATISVRGAIARVTTPIRQAGYVP
jgi:PAS domain S-box-containing protein